ncbi:MAG: 50S ribosomal protein L23 [Thermoflavifilum sp.]|nr:50S ribosomal protein L23 [Thermoflavifilum sp.]
MKAIDILIKPLVTEKSNQQAEKLNRYTFQVNRKANKLQIKKAVEEFYGVTVKEVNTSIIPGKRRNRYTISGVISGKKPAYKKAVVTLAEGESIDLYANV